MKKILSLLLVCCLIASLTIPFTACGNQNPWQTYTYYAMDTFLSMTVYGKDKAEACRQASELALEIEKKASATLATSEVSAFNEADESFLFSDEMVEILTVALAMCRATEGAYDITVAPLVSLWNINNGGPLPSEADIQKALGKVSYEKLTLEGNCLTKSDPEVKIDLGSVAKGYALGKMAEFLEGEGVIGTLNFGGNVALLGNKPDGTPWRVSLRDPLDVTAISGTLSLTGGFVAVSGDYERFFEENGVRYHHILSPKDGYPVRGIHSVAIISDNATEADLLSTALFVLGEEGVAALYEKGSYDFSYVMVLEGNQTLISPDLEGCYEALSSGA